MIGRRALLCATALVVAALLLPSACKRDQADRGEGGAEPRADARAGTRDLAALKKSGRLRVLVFGAEEPRLPRRGSSAAAERKLAQELARSLNLVPELVWVRSRDELLPALVEGRGDLVAASLTATAKRTREVAFTRPLRVVDEVLVGRAGASLPASKEAVKGVAVHVPASSSWADTATALGAKVVALSERESSEDILARVARGELPLTITDSDTLDHARTYLPKLGETLVVASGRRIGWAVRKEDKDLKAAADAFLRSGALRRDEGAPALVDRDGIQERGVLRVLTRNNAVTYFLHRGELKGFDFELAERVADELGVRLEMVVPPRSSDLIPWLLEGRGDMIAAAFTVTPTRAQKVAFTTPYLWVDELLVHRADEAPPANRQALAGKTVTVRPKSSYARTLRELRDDGVAVEIAHASSNLETEALIDAVARGELEYTVADSHIAAVETAWRDDVVATLPLTEAPADARDAIGKPRPGAKGIAFAVRREARALRAFLDDFVKRTYRSTPYNLLKRRYTTDRPEVAATRAEALREAGALSPFDGLFKKAGREHDVDWRLLAAVAYQESRFDPKARSWAGARGLFQIMPRTFAEQGGEDPEDPAQSTFAAARYLRSLIDSFDAALPVAVRTRMALASYNAGRGHVTDAQRLAKDIGKDPTRWFDHTEAALRLLSKPRWHRRARYGYCRSAEPIAYVREIQERFDAYLEATSRLPSGADAPHKG